MSFLDSFDEFDGGVYTAGKWAPDLQFVNRRSSAVIWPPGYLHETNSLPTQDGSCLTSVTVQYAFPQPVQFFRAFLPRLSLSSEVLARPKVLTMATGWALCCWTVEWVCTFICTWHLSSDKFSSNLQAACTDPRGFGHKCGWFYRCG